MLTGGVAILVLCAAALLGGEGELVLGFPLDDAWIHMVYGRSLASEGLLAFNPGTPSTGSTSPLWAVALAACHLALGWLSTDAVVVGVMLLGGLFFILSVILAADLVWRVSGRRVLAIAAGLAVAAGTPVAAAALSGMEVALTALLLLLTVRALVERHFGWAGLFLALASLARPEAASLAVVASVRVLGDPQVGTWSARIRVLGRLAAPSLLLGAGIVAYHLAVSGRPLPATFYFKEEASLFALPARLARAAEILFDVPPFLGWLGTLSLLGYLTPRPRPWGEVAPMTAALAFLLTNLVLIDPADPDALYHRRYLFPALPLLAVAAVIGASRLAALLPVKLASLPVWALTVLGLAGAGVSVGRVSERWHNDIRNIHEVQRTMGEWIARRTAPGTWVAATDVGAVRYFSQRPVVDLLGLNTPELYWEKETFVPRHPVQVLAVMPFWLQMRSAEHLPVLARMRTERYSVTSWPEMAEQEIRTCARPGRIEYRGRRDGVLECWPLAPR
jgi:hypothetical protein